MLPRLMLIGIAVLALSSHAFAETASIDRTPIAMAPVSARFTSFASPACSVTVLPVNACPTEHAEIRQKTY